MKSIPISAALSFGWQKTKENLGLLIGCVFMIFASTFVLDYGIEMLKEQHSILYFFLQIAASLFSAFLGIGLIIICLKIYNNEECSFSDLFSGGKYFIRYIVASIVQGIMVFFATLLFIIPGIIIGLMTCFYDYALINEDLGPIECIKKSMKLTKGVKMELFLFGIITLVINILGLLCLFVGIFVTAPITILAFIYVYRELLKYEEEKIFIEG